MIQCIDIHKHYHSGSVHKNVLRGVNFTINPRDRIGLLGRNGAGKSTLIRLIGGVEMPTTGKVVRKMSCSWPLGFNGGFRGSLTGFDNARFALGGAPVIGADYADGQYWDDAIFNLPDGAARAEATLHYQTVTRHYIEALRDGNVTDHWGDTLHRLWLQTNKCPPIEITSGELLLP